MGMLMRRTRDEQTRKLAEQDQAPATEQVDGGEGGKRLTPKQALQADAANLGLDTEGTVAELTARIDERTSELREQGAELDIADADTMPPADLAKAIDTKLA